jgi:hypothetical protein
MTVAGGLTVALRRTRAPALTLPAPAVRQEAPATTPAKHGPQVARGVLWAVVLIAACAFGAPAIAAVMIPVAVIASVSAVRAMPPGRSLATKLVAVGGPALAAASLIVADGQGANLALTLAVLVCFYDAACYLNGTGRGAGGAPGIAAGLVTVAILALFVAAVFVPPFTGVRPWAVLGLTGLAAPVGVSLAARVPGWRRLPALRRLDSLILAGPVWVILVAVLVHR